MNDVMAIANCWCCGGSFAFDPENVPSVWIDSATNAPPPPDHVPVTATRRPVCYRCAEGVAGMRAERGEEDLWNGQWGTPTP
jgi:hypothetical protein